MAGKDMTSIQRISLNGRWTVADLEDFLGIVRQLYSALYWLSAPYNDEHVEDDLPRWAWAWQAFPWRGGYSHVNFYNELYRAIPDDAKPHLVRFSYSSPGYIDIAGYALAFQMMMKAIHALEQNIEYALHIYNTTYREMRQRHLMDTDAREIISALEDPGNMHFVHSAKDDVGAALGMNDAVGLIDRLTGSELASLKILLSLFRRARGLIELAVRDKAKVME